MRMSVDHPAICFGDAGLDECDITFRRSQHVLLLCRGRVAGNLVFHVEGHWTVETRFREHAEESLPVDHAFAHRAVPLLPRAAALLPEEVLQRDHRQPRRDQVQRCAPPAVPPFDNRMTDVEVIPGGCRVERVDEGRKIPDRAAYIPCVVVISRDACRGAGSDRPDLSAVCRRLRAPCGHRRTHTGSSRFCRTGSSAAPRSRASAAQPGSASDTSSVLIIGTASPSWRIASTKTGSSAATRFGSTCPPGRTVRSTPSNPSPFSDWRELAGVHARQMLREEAERPAEARVALRVRARCRLRQASAPKATLAEATPAAA